MDSEEVLAAKLKKAIKDKLPFNKIESISNNPPTQISSPKRSASKILSYAYIGLDSDIKSFTEDKSEEIVYWTFPTDKEIRIVGLVWLKDGEVRFFKGTISGR